MPLMTLEELYDILNRLSASIDDEALLDDVVNTMVKAQQEADTKPCRSISARCWFP
jgi:hypothetical protein